MFLGEVEFENSGLLVFGIDPNSDAEVDPMPVTICTGCGALVGDTEKCRGKHQKHHHQRILS